MPKCADGKSEKGYLVAVVTLWNGPICLFLRRRKPSGEEAMKTFLSRFVKNKSGVTVDEYFLIAALIWIVVTIALQVIRANKPWGALNGGLR